MVSKVKRIGFVATGDELVNGDILNSNGPYFCRQLIQHFMIPGQHIIVGDNELEIQQAIEYLYPTHQAIITIGGLGPTADDRTRVGLANALDLPLQLYEEAWQWIVDKLSALGYDTVPENNRQQALLPKGSQALHNRQGTAAGCYIQHKGRDFFMLPGPPNECYPIFDEVVLQTLEQNGYATKIYRKSWLLLGVSEGHIAAKLEPFMQNYPDCQLGYRVSYPYLEIKLTAHNAKSIETLSEKFKTIFSNTIVSEERKTASEQLKLWLLKTKKNLRIEDQATHGAFLQSILTPETAPHLIYQPADIKIFIEGLQPYWQNITNISSVQVTLKMTQQHKTLQSIIDIPYRSSRTLSSAVERICLQVLKWLQDSSY